jgi:hypothetical protein
MSGPDIITPPADTPGPAISPLTTAGPHPHPVAADCPVECLDGLLSPQALRRLLLNPPGGEVTTAGDIARAHRQRTLSQVRGIGPGRIAEIEEVLLAAGLISLADCHIACAACDLARRQRYWLAVIDGPVIRYLRESHGFSQVHLARISGLSVSAVARAESQPASYCPRRVLNPLADALGVPPGGLEHPAHQHHPAFSENPQAPP